MTCAICGETSHLTRDCPQRHDRKKVEESRQRDHAYLQFMEELEGRSAVSPSPALPPEPVVPAVKSEEVMPAMDMPDAMSMSNVMPGMSTVPGMQMGSGMTLGSTMPAMSAITTPPMGSGIPGMPMMTAQPMAPAIQPVEPMPMMRPGVIGYSQESLRQSWQQNPMQNLRR